MFLIGLTGSIGMGKSATGRMFAARGIPVHDADAEVHKLYQAEAVAPIREAFPAAVVGAGVDRERLSRLVIGDTVALRRLEAIVHPLVRAQERRFLDRCFAAGHRHVVLEVPLLFETGSELRVDAVVVTSAPADLQRRRVMERGGMTIEKLDAILARQLPDGDKRRRSHFIVDTGRDFAFAEKQVDDILRAIAGCPGNAYRRRRLAGDS